MQKSVFGILLASTCLINQPLLADDFQISAPIKAVTVYQNGGAKVTRTASYMLPKGQHRLVIQNLQENITNTDVQPIASIVGENVKLKAVKFANQPAIAAGSAEQQQLRQKIKAVVDDIKKANDRIAATNIQLSFLKSVGYQRGSKTSLDLSEMKKTMAFMGEQSLSLLETIQNDQRTIEELQSRKASLERELVRNGKQNLDYKQALLTVQNPREQKIEISFSYFVMNADWSMDVLADLDSQAEILNLQLAATVTQTSGEPWDNVALSLSNAMPSNYLGNTTLPSLFLNLRDKGTNVRAAMPRLHKAESMDSMADFSGNMSVTNTGYNRLYTINGMTSLAANDSLEQLVFNDTRAKARLVSRAVPRNDKTAYIYADTILTDFNSLRGVNAALSVDRHYVGKGNWPNLEADTRLQLPFGKDENIEIEYIEQPPEDGDTGFINKKSVEEKRYLIKVTNHNTRDSLIEIIDQYPVSAHEDITVTRLKEATKPDNTNLNDQPGIVSWTKNLKPGEQWVIRHEYRVAYPSSKQLNRQMRR